MCSAPRTCHRLPANARPTSVSKCVTTTSSAGSPSDRELRRNADRDPDDIIRDAVEEGTATAVMILIRFATLWWAVAVGFAALAVLRLRFGEKLGSSAELVTPSESAQS